MTNDLETGRRTEINLAFIDAQNLYLGTTQADNPWILDLARFRVYLAQKYHVSKAYYFFGAYDNNRSELYDFIRECGYILRFREHVNELISRKKGNVDTDIVFLIMKKLCKNADFDKIVLVSGDGDYKKLVSFLIEEGRFEKLLVPNRKRMSSLYKQIDTSYRDALDSADKRVILEYRKNKTGSPKV
jgi:uncharacterized LabA/DUF88 family protein